VILEAVAAVTAACKALEMAAGAANNIESIGSYIGKLGAAEFDLSRAKNSKKNMSEAEAMKIVMAEETLRQSRENIKNTFLAVNILDLYNDMMKKMAEARKKRQEAIRQEAAKKAEFKKQIKQVGLIAAIVLVLVPAAVGGLLTWLTNR
jgi:hypothetical protein